jgi:hypothetical protein
MKNYTEEDIKNTDFKHILATSSEEEDVDNANNIDELALKKKKKLAKKGGVTEDKEEATGGDEEDERLRKYRELLFGAEAKPKKQRDADLEFSWDGGIEQQDGFNELMDFNSKSKF